MKQEKREKEKMSLSVKELESKVCSMDSKKTKNREKVNDKVKSL